MKQFLPAVFALVALQCAAEQTVVCARDESGITWRAPALVLTGRELDDIDVGRGHDPLNKYVVIRLSPHDTWRIELDYDERNLLDTPGRDELGRRWYVSSRDSC